MSIQIVEAGGGYVWFARGNQPQLEERTLTVSSQLNDFLDWPYLQQVFRLERRFLFMKTGEIQEQVVYGLTSLSREEIVPGKLLALIRSY